MLAVRALARLTLAGLVFSLGPNCAAAPFAVQVGDVRVALDAPPGFADTAFTGSPRLQELAESLTSPSNRVLLYALTDGDLRLFMSGDRADLRRQTLVVTPRELEQERMRPESFTAYANESLRSLGAVPPQPASQDYRALLDPQPGSKVLLAELRHDSSSVAILQGMRLPSPPPGLFGKEKPAQYVLQTTTLIQARGKVLNLQVFTAYDGAADLEWLRSATLRWADELLRLNSR